MHWSGPFDCKTFEELLQGQSCWRRLPTPPRTILSVIAFSHCCWFFGICDFFWKATKADAVALQELSFTHASLRLAVARADFVQLCSTKACSWTTATWYRLVKNILACVALDCFSDPSGAVTLVELQGSRESRGIVLATIWLQPGARSTTEIGVLVCLGRSVAMVYSARIKSFTWHLLNLFSCRNADVSFYHLFCQFCGIIPWDSGIIEANAVIFVCFAKVRELLRHNLDSFRWSRASLVLVQDYP